MTIHIVGAGGMLGRDVLRAAGGDAVALTHADLDVTDTAAVADVLGGASVINCAAYTDVDGAESEAERARAVNEDGARNVAAAADRVVYVSTDYVFDGTKREPYLESDAPGPIQVYGRTKLAGERATVEANPKSQIVRTSWLFGPGSRNFVETMLALAGEGRPLRVVDDQVGCPTFTGHLAGALVDLAGTEEYGVHHVAGAGACSWYEFAEEIFARAGVEVDLHPCTTAGMPRPARRPAWSVLGSERADRVALPAWQHGLDAYLGVRA